MNALCLVIAGDVRERSSSVSFRRKLDSGKRDSRAITSGALNQNDLLKLKGDV